jgi:hypothetical protein
VIGLRDEMKLGFENKIMESIIIKVDSNGNNK